MTYCVCFLLGTLNYEYLEIFSPNKNKLITQLHK